MAPPPWHDLPFLTVAPGESSELAALRAVRWLLQRGVVLRADGDGFKAVDAATGHGIHHANLDWCVYQACLALHTAAEARARSGQTPS
jgi:hypothetical protein